MTKKLEGKTAVITGGTEGIGLATAKRFVEEGAYVFITGRRQKELDEAVKAIGANVSGVQGDIAQLAGDSGSGSDETVAQMKSRIDIVSRQRRGWRIRSFGPSPKNKTDRRLFNINVRGTLFTVQKALPLLNDGGSIILNGSVASVKGTAAFGVYAASKAALRSFVRTWTTDLKDRRIRSNVVSPGPINTPLASRQSAEVIARIVSTIPMGRTGSPRKLRMWRCFWRRMTPVSSPVSNCSLTAAEPRSRSKGRKIGMLSSTANSQAYHSRHCPGGGICLLAPSIPAIAPDVPPGETARPWPPISSTLISGERDAVLVDTPITVEQAVWSTA